MSTKSAYKGISTLKRASYQAGMSSAEKPACATTLATLHTAKRNEIRNAYLAKYRYNGVGEAIAGYMAYERKFVQTNHRFPTIAEYMDSLVK